MKVNAYILAGDPAWAGASLASYYHLVRRVFVSYDRDRLSWSGHPLDVDPTIRALEAADPDGKIIHIAGAYSDPGVHPLACETRQRQAALDAASEDSDWVLQLDSDEVMANPSEFMEQLVSADSVEARALDYPLRNLQQHAGDDVYLEACGRLWTRQASYPGPVAVRAGTELSHCRQTAVEPIFRVDFRPRNTDPWQSRDRPVDAVIDPADAVWHFSWVRTDDEMVKKSLVSGHASAFDWDERLRVWRWQGRHPWLAAVTAPFRHPGQSRVRLSRVPLSPEWVEKPAAPTQGGSES